MDKAIPPGINYADIKPEAIENQIRIVKFTPIATVQQAQQNDVVRFHIQGNGFYDPYSAYIRLEVECTDLPTPTVDEPFVGKFIDRSAHSFFSRLVIRSQGTELERIEQYDVMAAMVNDMIYSQEQRILHHYEGMPTSCSTTALPTQMQYDLYQDGSHLQSLPFLYQGAAQTIQTGIGDFGFWKMYVNLDNIAAEFDDGGNHIPGIFSSQFGQQAKIGQIDLDAPIGYCRDGQPCSLRSLFFQVQLGAVDNIGLIGISVGGFIARQNEGLIPPNIRLAADSLAQTNLDPVLGIIIESPTSYVFTIPIYSGILGVMMPEKKFLPMSLLPLEVEFTINPHALYPVGNLVQNRRYIVKKFEIWTHTLFFDQELHRSLEAVVAENGIFIHYNSFYLTPINTYNQGANTSIPNYNQLGVYLKSISAIHWVFVYAAYEQENGPRKLHFVSHNMKQLQLRNGMDLMPSEPIQARTGGDSFGTGGIPGNNHAQFLIETFKAWNKMHDPLSDCNLNPFNYNLDNQIGKAVDLGTMVKQQKQLGRCQYGLTLEGEQLGQQRSVVCGKKSTMPFDINMLASKSGASVSYMFCFLRADFIIYVRPDLVVTRLGI